MDAGPLRRDIESSPNLVPHLRQEMTRPAALEPTASEAATETLSRRPEARGKFLFVGDRKLTVKGVSYGAFRPDTDGREYNDVAILDRDFAMMAAYGFNAVRIPHTMPPVGLLDLAWRHGLRVMVGLSAEQYVGYLIDRRGAPDIVRMVTEKAKTVAGHPALLCYGIGNEIPASIARWIGRRPLERYLRRLYDAIKECDPDGLVTYVNYPSTEYLDLPFLDLISFNVYLEQRDLLESYLARLHNLAGDRPVLLAELGLDSLRNGELGQARTLEWQLESTFAAGCIGAFIFSWTDEWWRGGAAVDDWKFGLTTVDRRPKPALTAVARSFERQASARSGSLPRISVIVCTYNGGRTLRECLTGISGLAYPDHEAIVVDDGSTDDTAAIAADFPIRLISTRNQGLSAARNTGLSAATGEIVAYVDDDAFPDPDWLTYLASAFQSADVAAVGGPNIPPVEDRVLAACVASAPGGPAHVLLADQIAEHIPGCNMAFRKVCLEAIGGFDPQFRKAGDDVDVCWSLHQAGWKIGFKAAAQVWHRRRGSVRAYWKQQAGYGEAEALLERKWPEKYNVMGHISWGGRVYHSGLTLPLPLRRTRVYHGVWGMAPFQSAHRPAPGLLLSLPLMPEWYLVAAFLASLSLLGFWWPPLLAALPLLAVALGLPVVQAVYSARRAVLARGYVPGRRRALNVGVTAWLHLLHPLARLWGRLRYGLTPWRHRGSYPRSWPLPFRKRVWSETWLPPEERLASLESFLRSRGAAVARGGDYERWDLEARVGLFGAARCAMACEDHGSGTQYVRFRAWPCSSAGWTISLLLLLGLAALASLDGTLVPALLLGGAAALVAVFRINGVSAAIGLLREATRRIDAPPVLGATDSGQGPERHNGASGGS